MLKLETLNFDTVCDYVKNKLKGEMYFSSLIATDFDLSLGNFYSIVPEGLTEKVIYSFDYGGYVYPFVRNNNEQTVKTENVSKAILSDFVYQYVLLNKLHCLGIEDFSASPDSKYVKSSEMKYGVIDNRLFYLLDGGYSYNEIIEYFNFSNGYIFLGLLLNLDIENIKEIKSDYYKEIPKRSLDAIYAGIESFFLEIYDGESYLFWVKKGRGDILRLLHQCIETHNNC